MPNLIKGAYEAMQPDGPIHAQEAGGDTDLLFDGIADNETRVQEFLATLAKIRDPFLTPVLADLEKEYGIITDLDLTEAERRENLAALVYATRGTGSRSYLEARLHEAGFTDLFVYNNSPAVDPNLFITQGYGSWCGDEETVCGNEEAFCSLYEGGEYVVNGDIFNQCVDQLAVCGNEDIVCGNGEAFCGNFQELKTPVEYTVPSATDSADLLIDGNMEEVGVNPTDWPGEEGGVVASKSLVAPYAGVRSLQVDDGRTLDVLDGDNGVSKIPQDKDINSQEVAPTFIYLGSDPDLIEWIPLVGDTLDFTGSGANPTLDIPAYGNGANDRTIRFPGVNTKHYEDPVASFGTFTTNDFTIGFIGSQIGSSGKVIATHRNPGVNFGWQLFIGAGPVLTLRLETASGSTDVSTGTIPDGAFVYRIYVDRSAFAQPYINGIASGSAVNVSARSGTLDDGTNLSIGATVVGGGVYDEDIVYFSGHEKANWFSTHLNSQDATNEFQKWCDLYPELFTGTPNPTAVTAEKTFIEQYIAADDATYTHHISDGIAPVGRILDGSLTAFTGARFAPFTDQKLLYSNDFDTGWTKDALTSIDTGTTEETSSPGIFYQGLIADGTSAQHGMSIAQTLAAGSTVISFESLPGDLGWVEYINTTSGAFCYFDLSTGAIGSHSGTDDRGIIPSGNGKYFFWVVETVPNGINNIRLFSAPDNNDNTFTGDTITVQTWVSFAQIEPGTFPGPRILTEGVADTRAADEITYKLDDGNIVQGQGTIDFDFLTPYGPTSSTTFIFSMNDGTANNYIRALINFQGKLVIEVKTGGVTQMSTLGTVLIGDGDSHSIRIKYEDGSLEAWIDDVSDISGTPTTIPTTLTQCEIVGNQALFWINGPTFFANPKEPGDIVALTRPQTKGQRYYLIAFGKNTSLESKPQIKDGDSVTLWEGVDTDSDWEFIEREWVAQGDALKLTMDGELGKIGFDNMALFERSLNGNWNLVFFVGGAVTRDSGDRIIDIERVPIASNLRDSLRRIILRHKPLQTWGALVVNFT